MIILTNVEVREMSGEKRLPDTELEVMTAIWKCEIPVKTSEIARHIERDWTMSTIQALLARLEEKGYVSVVKEGRLKTYVPLISEEEYSDQETVRFFERFHRKSVRSLFMTLVKNESLTEADLEELEAIIRKEEKRND